MHAAAIGAAAVAAANAAVAAAATAGSSSGVAATVMTTTSFVMQGHKTTKVWAENEHDMMMTRLSMERDGLLEAVVKWEQEHEAALAAAEAATAAVAAAAAAAAIESEANADVDVEAADIQEQGSGTATETFTTVATAMETTAGIPMTLATGDISSSVGVDTVSADGSVAQEALPPSSDDTDMLVDQSVASTTMPEEPLSQVA
ncbi:hypothetical protein DFQ26_001105 [Actinomortierella ambigua]|nr:hypothetical protein DFQ26_001105 [Actinomortierella ambigua]